jgi:hypothetical protein
VCLTESGARRIHVSRWPPGRFRRRLKGWAYRAVEVGVTHRLHPFDSHAGRRRAGRKAAVAAIALVTALALPTVAGAAGVRARSTGTSTVSAGTWGVAATVTSMTFTTNTAQTSTVTNIGTVALTAHSYSVTISKPPGRAPTFNVYRCPVAWVSTTCPGGAGTQIGGTLSANSTTTISTTTALAPGASIYLEVQPSGVRRATTVSITPQVTAPSQIRVPVQSNQ